MGQYGTLGLILICIISIGTYKGCKYLLKTNFIYETLVELFPNDTVRFIFIYVVSGLVALKLTLLSTRAMLIIFDYSCTIAN